MTCKCLQAKAVCKANALLEASLVPSSVFNSSLLFYGTALGKIQARSPTSLAILTDRAFQNKLNKTHLL